MVDKEYIRRIIDQNIYVNNNEEITARSLQNVLHLLVDYMPEIGSQITVFSSLSDITIDAPDRVYLYIGETNENLRKGNIYISELRDTIYVLDPLGNIYGDMTIYTSVEDVLNNVPLVARQAGQTYIVREGDELVEYWFNDPSDLTVISKKGYADPELDSESTNSIQNRAVWMAIEQLKGMISYAEISITNFSGGAQKEIGSIYTPTLSITTSKTPLSIKVNDGNRDHVINVNPNQTQFSIQMPSVSRNTTYTCTVTELNPLTNQIVTKTKTVSVTFSYKTFYLGTNTPYSVNDSLGITIRSNFSYTYGTSISENFNKKYFYLAIKQGYSISDAKSNIGEPLKDFFVNKGTTTVAMGGTLTERYIVYEFHLLSDEPLDQTVTITIQK